MPGKTLITGTLYLITVEMGDYHTYDTPFRLYTTRAKADRFMERLKRHMARKPVEPGNDATEEESDKWYQELQAWQKKHPGGADHTYRDFDAWKIRPMAVC